MLQEKYKSNMLLFTLLITFFVAVASYCGIFIEMTYSLDNSFFAAQGIGQDIINLFLVVPFLLVSALLIYFNNKQALFLWGGAVFYILYSYALYCFAVHFNFLFLVYCIILGLSVYALIYYSMLMSTLGAAGWFDDKTPVKLIAGFLIIIAVLFYMIWLSEIIPALLNNTTPKSITESGLLTNPVHVLDISIVLPAICIIAIAIRQRKAIGFIFIPVVLVFCILMTLAICGMIVYMYVKGFESNPGIAIIFVVVSFLSIGFLILFLRHLKI